MDGKHVRWGGGLKDGWIGRWIDKRVGWVDGWMGTTGWMNREGERMVFWINIIQDGRMQGLVKG